MITVFGLGNPGNKYKRTRHNIGYMLLDKLACISKKDFKKNQKLKSEILVLNSTILAKPKTYMNNSGDAVLLLVNYYHIKKENLWVVHDDLDIHLGEYKIQYGKGPKTHNGIESINNKIGHNYWRVRIGIENRQPNLMISGEKYVLDKFDREEMIVVDKVLDQVVRKINKIHRQ